MPPACHTARLMEGAGGGTAEHWDTAYAHGDDTCSWFQSRPVRSLALLDRAGITPADSLIDVGGGAARLVDELVQRGFVDLTVLDISQVALSHARARLGPSADRVTWVAADLCEWEPTRTYRVWHDRAVLHFFTSHDQRCRYRRALEAASAPGTVAVFGCFAPDGPPSCSGLPVTRYDPSGIAELLGSSWELVAHEREEHTTPRQAVQPFTWAAFRRTGG